MADYQYQRLVNYFCREINEGVLPAGARMPSIRSLARSQKLSKTTVITAYSQLEAKGLIESRPKSGFFVSPQKKGVLNIRNPAMSQPIVKPAPVSTSQIIIDLMEKAASFDLLPKADQPPENVELRQCLSRAQRKETTAEQRYYDEPLGYLALRQQVAIRVHHSQKAVTAEDVVITHGCQHSLLLALMSTTEPGDIVAIESPSFYGAIQLLETLNRKVIELPSSPVTGIDVDAFESAAKKWDIKALIISPNYSTPTGACMPDTHKVELLNHCIEHHVVIIEDDIYSDLHFGLNKPRSIYSFDTAANVMLCSSFSKTLSRDIRLGWILPGRSMQKVKRLKIVTSIATGITLQKGLAMYLEQGSYERYIRKKRSNLEIQSIQWQDAIKEHLLSVQSCSFPKGGLALWAELPKQIDTIKLYEKAQVNGITITPGPLFSSQNKYKNYLRLSFSEALTTKRKEALNCLGQLIKEFK
jgi:DNA-binding transcriptional MocR family regulator